MDRLVGLLLCEPCPDQHLCREHNLPVLCSCGHPPFHGVLQATSPAHGFLGLGEFTWTEGELAGPGSGGFIHLLSHHVDVHLHVSPRSQFCGSQLYFG